MNQTQARVLTQRERSAAAPLTLVALIVFVSAFVPVPAMGRQPFDAILARLLSYASAYEEAFSGLVAEERYEQEARNPRVGASFSPRYGRREGIVLLRQARKMRSSFLLIRIPDRGLVPFRDVVEVDGAPVHDRTDRLRRLLEQPSATSVGLAVQITEESARYNLSDVDRTVNVPTFALRLLHSGNTTRLKFRDDGASRLDGRTVRTVSFEETGRPTIVRTKGGLDLPSSGTIWFDQDSGTIWQTKHTTKSDELASSISVKYSHVRDVPLPVPVRLDEYYETFAPTTIVRGTATYTKYQQVKVQTQTVIGK